jgi:hypothetical protein
MGSPKDSSGLLFLVGDRDCSSVCEQHSAVCAPEYFALINSCSVLQKHFPCSSCVIDSKEPVAPGFDPGSEACFTLDSKAIFDCSAQKIDRKRLCICAET